MPSNEPRCQGDFALFREAARAALSEVDANLPLLQMTAEMLVRACVRAAVLYPEWAAALGSASSDDVDGMARRLVARNWRELRA